MRSFLADISLVCNRLVIVEPYLVCSWPGRVIAGPPVLSYISEKTCRYLLVVIALTALLKRTLLAAFTLAGPLRRGRDGHFLTQNAPF
jgi:hypothetical protein